MALSACFLNKGICLFTGSCILCSQPCLSPFMPKWILWLWVLNLPLHHPNFSFSCTVDLNKSYIIFSPVSPAPHIQLPNSAKNTEMEIWPQLFASGPPEAGSYICSPWEISIWGCSLSHLLTQIKHCMKQRSTLRKSQLPCFGILDAGTVNF